MTHRSRSYDRTQRATASIYKPIHNVKDAKGKPLATRPQIALGRIWFPSLENLRHYAARLVEPIGIEPMTPCLQSRCSPS